MVARAVAFLAGVLAALAAAAWLVPLAVCWLAAGAGLWRWPPARSWVAFSVCGLMLSAWHIERAQQRRITAPATIAAVGCVTGPVRVAGNTLRFDTTLYDPGYAGDVADVADVGVSARRVQLTSYRPTRIPVPGECWYWTMRLLPPRGLLNFHGADTERRLFAGRIDARGQVRTRRARRVSTAGSRAWFLRARVALAHRLRFLIGEHRYAGVPLALAVGVRDTLSADDWRTFSATGTGHLMAISGLHVGLVAAFGFAAGRLLPSAGRRHGLLQAWLCALACAGAYAALAGFTLPTRRALIMLGTFAAAAVTMRRYAPADVLALALVLTLILDPFAVLGAGLWFSYGAVAALLVGRGPAQAGPVVLQGAVFLGLLPLVAGWTGTLVPLSPLANLVCIPLFSAVVIPLTLLATALAPFTVEGAALLFGAVLALLAPVLDWLRALATLSWSMVPLPSRPAWTIFAALGGVLLILLRVRAAGAVALVACLPLLVGRPARLAEGAWRITALDVGQGMAVLIETRDHVLLYDSGNVWRTTDAGAVVAVPQLQARGWRTLDTLVVSHADQDHAGGVASVLRALPVGTVYAGESMAFGGRPTRRCRAGWAWRSSAVEFAFLHPDGEPLWQGNDASCVLRVSGAGCSALLTGDIEALAEVSLLWTGAPLAADVVAGQHHGSRTSSSRDFVAATAPAYVLFSTGYMNRWGFPDPRIAARWQAAGALPLDTATHGALSLTCDPHRGLGSPHSARASRPGPWRQR